MSMQSQIAANTIDGVYVCENPSIQDQRRGAVVLEDMDFYESLATLADGVTIYGNVSDSVVEKIESDYGIR